MSVAERHPREGTVVTFDEATGYGDVREPAGEQWRFHCTAIADGSRVVAVGAAVRFQVAPGHLGRYEAVDVRRLRSASP